MTDTPTKKTYSRQRENGITTQTWEQRFDEKFVNKIQISEDEFDVGFKGNVQDLYNFIKQERHQVFEDGKKAERERIIKMISKMQQEFKEATNDGGAVNYDAGVNATFDDVLAALTKE